MASKRKHTDRTYEENYRVIKFCDENPGIKRSDIALKFAIKPQTLSYMMKVETKKKVFNVVENSPDARKGTIEHVKIYVSQHRCRAYYLVPSVLYRS